MGNVTQMAPLGNWFDGLLSVFKRAAPIVSVGDVEDFIDRHAAFGVQKCIIEYCRARAGIQWSKLFKEKEFLEALDAARWKAFGIGVGNVTEMVDATLRPHAGAKRNQLVDALTSCGRHVLQRYPLPGGFAEDFWAGEIAAFETRMAKVKMRAPHAVRFIPVESSHAFFAFVPIHADLRGLDFEMIQNNLRVNLCRSYETFIKRADEAAVVADLLRPAAPVKVPAL